MKISYRPDIDALRGIAVLSVLFYHAKFTYLGVTLFSGGFLGVDIFFVLTGFLITTLLFKEYKKNNNINILNFYLRRVRRLVPALLVVVVIATLFSFFYLDPVKLKEFSASVFFSLTFLANLYFHYFGDHYGAEANLSKPLLHLWSLGIEEQFYIFYPLVLTIIFKYAKRYFLFFLSLGFFSSFLMAEYVSTYHKQFSFYMLPSRAWEIITGSLLAVILLNKKKDFRLSKNIENFIYLFCIVIIFTCFFLFNVDYTKHPSSITLIPLLAVALMILIGDSQKKCSLFYFFSNNFLIYFGKISYSLYLFHFIIFSFFRNSYIEETFFIKIFLIIISIIASMLSYKYVEQVFRSNSFPVKKLFNYIYIFLIIIISSNSYFILNKKLLDNDYLIDGINITEWHDTKRAQSHVDKYNAKDFTNNNKINVLLVGNCHADDSFLALYYNKDKFVDYNFILYPRTNVVDFQEAIDKKNKLYKDADIIIFSTRWDSNEEIQDINSLENLNNSIKNDNKRLIVFSHIPEFTYEEARYKLRKIELTNYKRKIVSIGSTALGDKDILDLKKKYYYDYINNKKIINTNNKLEKITKSNNIEYIDLVKLICDHSNETCNFRLDDSKDELFRDYGRFSYRGSIYLGNLLFQNNFLSK